MDWGQGRYEVVAEQLLPVAEVVVEEAGLSPGERVVDVGCGTGNGALLAAERGATVVGVDPAKRLLDVAASRAAERQIHVSFLVGDAESIPVPDDGADVVLSVFGAIFAPDPEEAAAEMARVLDPDGRMLLSAWIPEGPVSQAVRLSRETINEILGQPPAQPPFPWHEGEGLERLFGRHGLAVSVEQHEISFGASSAREFIELEERNHPLAVAARPVVEKAGRGDELREALLRHYEEANEDSSGFLVTSRYVIAKVTPR